MFQSGMAVISTATAAEVARGVSRLLMQEGFSPILEFTLANGRRLDVAALGPDGTMLGVEIKVALADLRGDTNGRNISNFASFSISRSRPIFPTITCRRRTGLIVADRYGGAIVRPADPGAGSCQPPQGRDPELRQSRRRPAGDDARSGASEPPQQPEVETAMAIS